MRKSVFWVSFITIVLFAFYIRFYRLGQVPVSLYWDEIAMYVDIKSALQSGQDMFGRPWFQLIYPSYGDFKLPIYIWSALLSAKIFGLSEWSFRLPSVLVGVGTVLLGGFLSRFLFAGILPHTLQKNQREMSRDLLQLVTMGLIACTPWSIMFSRTGFEGHIGQFLLGLSVLFVFLSKKYPKLIFLSPIFGAFATYAYFSVRFVWMVVFLTALLLVHFDVFKKIPKNFFPSLKNILFFFIGPVVLYGVLLMPMMKSPLYRDADRFRLGTDSVLNKEYVIQSNVYRQLAGNSRIDRVLFNSKVLMGMELLKNYATNMSPNFMFVQGDPNLRHGTTQHGLFLFIALPFFLYGLISLFNKDKRVLGFLVIWWLIALLPASVPVGVPHALRSLNALLPVSLIIAFGITAGVIDWLNILHVSFKNSQLRTMSQILSLGFLGVVCVFSVAHFLYFYFTFYPQLSAYHWQDGHKQLAQAIYKERASEDKILITHFDDRFYLWLLAFGPYTAEDFHSWKSERYQFLRLGDEPIFFQNVSDDTVLQQKSSLLVVGEFKQLNEQLSAMKIKPEWIKEVHGVSPEEKFLLAKFKQP
jgi:hypothetical protein